MISNLVVIKNERPVLTQEDRAMIKIMVKIVIDNSIKDYEAYKEGNKVSEVQQQGAKQWEH
jgi:hypothetical protein